MNGPVDPRKIFNALLRRDFLAFAERCFQELEPGKAFQISNHMIAIAYQLQRVMAGDIKRLIISMPPRMLKSHLVSISFPAFLMAHNPGIRIVSASHTTDLAQTFSTKTRSILQSGWYKEVAPRVKLTRATQTDIDTTCGGSRFGIGVGGGLLGRGGDIIIIDDAMASDGGVSEAERRSVWDWFTGVVGSRLDNPKEGAIVVVAQRLHVDDLTGKLLALKGWTHLMLPAIAWEDQEIALSPTKIWKRKAGDLLMPARLGMVELNQMKAMQEHRFEAQYQQRPSPPSGYLFKVAKFRKYDRRKLPLSQLEAVIISVDTAVSISESADFTAISVWGIRGPCLYLRHVERGRWSFRKQIERLNQLYGHFKADAILVENHASGPMVIDELRNVGLRVEYISHTQDKGARAEKAELKVHQGLVHVDPEMRDYVSFMKEIADFPHGRHDDWVDSMTQLLVGLENSWPRLQHASFYRHHRRDRPRIVLENDDPWLIENQAVARPQ